MRQEPLSACCSAGQMLCIQLRFRRPERRLKQFARMLMLMMLLLAAALLQANCAFEAGFSIAVVASFATAFDEGRCQFDLTNHGRTVAESAPQIMPTAGYQLDRQRMFGARSPRQPMRRARNCSRPMRELVYRPCAGLH